MFSYLRIEKDEKNKYWLMWDRYLTENPVSVLKKHNFAYPALNDPIYLSVCADEERSIFLMLVHCEDVDFALNATPMAWVIFVDDNMILLNCGYEHEFCVDPQGEEWVEESFSFEHFDVPDQIEDTSQVLEENIKEALDEWTKIRWSRVGFLPPKAVVTFNVPWVFPGYAN